MAPVESLRVAVPRRRLGAYEEPAADRNVVCLRGEYDMSTVPRTRGVAGRGDRA